MSMIVIMPGGFHPFHAGHFALYQSAKQAFPNADVYVAATNDMSERPFPFALKEKLAKLAGVDAGHFIQVKSPFKAEEITKNYDPNSDVLVFVRSEKDRNEQPKPGGTKKDGSPAYFQPWTGKNLQPFSKHAYMAYLPTVEFGPGITSATQIRKAWPTLNDKRKTALVMSLYPAAQKNPKLAQNVVGMFDQVMGGQVEEGLKNKLAAAAMAAGTAMSPGTSHGIAGAFPTPSAQQKMYKDAADSNRAEAQRQAELQRQADEKRLKKGTQDIERLNQVNYHGKNAPIQTDAEWDGDSSFMYLNGIQLKMASRMPIRGDVPSNLKLIVTKEGRQVYIWTRSGLKGAMGYYFYPADNPKTINEFAPDEGGGSRKFIPWNEFVDQLKQILHKDFDCKESINMDVIKAKFVPYDPMEYGPTQIYSYFERRAGRDKGANSVRGQIQVGKFFQGSKPGENQLMTGYSLLKGTEFERYFDLTFDNLYKIANIIKGNTQGALQMQPKKDVAEGWTKLPSGDYQNSHTGVRTSKPPVKKKRGEKTGAEWDAIEKAKKEQGVAEDKSKVIAKTVKDLENPPKIMQHRAKRDQEREETYRNAQFGRDDLEDDGDVELQQLMRKAQQHYPTMPGKQKAFIKFVQRALKHSEEEDNQQDKEINQIKSELNKIQQDHKKIMKVSESSDYLEEK